MCVVSGLAAGGIIAGGITAATVATDLTLLATVAATSIAIAQSQEQAKAAQEQANFQEDQARYEAVIADRAAKVELVKDGIRSQKEFGRIRNQLAATGNQLGFGSTGRVVEETAQFQAINQALIAQNAQNAAAGTTVKIQGFRFGASNARSGANFQSAGLALSGAASFGSTVTSRIRAQQRFDLLNGSPSQRVAGIYDPVTAPDFSVPALGIF